MGNQGRFRLVTRSDFDGLVCAVLLKEKDLIDDIKFVHPKDVQDGKIDITDRDITTNLPYVPQCHLALDHHSSEVSRIEGTPDNLVLEPEAKSAARVVYDHFGGKEAFPRVSDEMMDAVDKADSAAFSEEEVLDPQEWVLLNFLMDARTGLGRFKTFATSNYQLMMELIDACRDHDIHEILGLPDVLERVVLYRSHEKEFRAQLERCTTVHENLVVIDLTDEETVYVGNRFQVYALHPQCNISIHENWRLNQQNTQFANGKSILNRTSKTNIGELALSYGGGGHKAAGTCQVDNDEAKKVRSELIAKITADG
jgi:nanoRNase/pAp phosphatase (c-di-AMP/oligoRNAs hydrolase)